MFRSYELGRRTPLNADPLGSVRLKQVVALIALVWLIGALLLMGRSIRRGRELAAELASRHPDIYEALGRPRPGYLQSVRRDRFARFVAHREYEGLSDPVLAAEFEAYRQYEARLVISLLASMGVVFLLVMAVRHAAQQGVAAHQPQLGSIDLGCRLAAYCVGRVGSGQRCRWPLNADPLGGDSRGPARMALPTVIYFDIRARAEPIRLILEEMGIQYEDRHITDGEWLRLRPKTPFGWLPAYRDKDLEIWQSHAIYRHLARVHNLYGSTEAERIRCDVVEEALADLNTLIGRAPWRPDFERTREEFIDSELSPVLDRLQRFLRGNSFGSSFWVGSSLTFVDLVALAHLDCTGSMFPEALPGHDTLQGFCDGIAQRPRIAAYLRSDRRPQGIQYGPGGRIEARSREGWVAA